MKREARSRELFVAIAIALLVGLAFVAISLSTVAAREDLDALERSIESAVEEAAPGTAIPRPACDQQEAGMYRCFIAASEEDPAGFRTSYLVQLGEDGCWRLPVEAGSLTALDLGVLEGCVADYPD